MPKKNLLDRLEEKPKKRTSKSKQSSKELRHAQIETPKLKFKFDTQRMKILKNRGVDGSPLSLARSPFSLDDALVRIRPETTWLPEDFNMKAITVKRQVSDLDKLLNNPLHGSYIAAIGSYPSDVRAKLLALNLFNNAIDMQMQGSHRGKAYPLWHRLYGNLGDPVRDKEQEHISMLVITNVGADSSNIKLEKLRDLLEMYDNIPRIVVVNGTDPVSFFAEKIRKELRYAFYLNAEIKPQSSLLESL